MSDKPTPEEAAELIRKVMSSNWLRKSIDDIMTSNLYTTHPENAKLRDIIEEYLVSWKVYLEFYGDKWGRLPRTVNSKFFEDTQMLLSGIPRLKRDKQTRLYRFPNQTAICAMICYGNPIPSVEFTFCGQSGASFRSVREAGWIEFGQQESERTGSIITRYEDRRTGVPCRHIVGFNPMCNVKKQISNCTKGAQRTFLRYCDVCGSKKDLEADHRCPRATANKMGMVVPEITTEGILDGSAHHEFRSLCKSDNDQKREICLICQAGGAIRNHPMCPNPHAYKQNWNDGDRSCDGCFYHNPACPLRSKLVDKEFIKHRMFVELNQMPEPLRNEWVRLYEKGEVELKDFWDPTSWDLLIRNKATLLIAEYDRLYPEKAKKSQSSATNQVEDVSDEISKRFGPGLFESIEKSSVKNQK